MKTHRIICYVAVSFLILSGLTFCLPSYGERSVVVPAAPQPQQPPSYSFGYGPGFYDTGGATFQRVSTIEQELNSVNADLRMLSDQTSKQDMSVKEILEKLGSIEQNIDNINARLKTLEEKAGIQGAGIKKAGNRKELSRTELNNMNKVPAKAD